MSMPTRKNLQRFEDQAWVAHQELKDTRVQSKTYENELERLRRRFEHKEAIRVLEKELKDAGVFLGL
jgi:hypothetical protein